MMARKYEYREEVALKVSRIMELAYEVNCKTDYAIFIRFSGHVDSFDIDIAEGKDDKKYFNKVGQIDTYLSHFSENAEVVKELEGVISKLEGLLPEKVNILKD